MNKTVYVVKYRFQSNAPINYAIFNSLHAAKKEARSCAQSGFPTAVIEVSEPFTTVCDDIDYRQKKYIGVSEHGKMRWHFEPDEDTWHYDGLPEVVACALVFHSKK